jgi:hypothetical protein
LIEFIYKKRDTKEANNESYARFLRFSNLKLNDVPFYDLRRYVYVYSLIYTSYVLINLTLIPTLTLFLFPPLPFFSFINNVDMSWREGKALLFIYVYT